MLYKVLDKVDDALDIPLFPAPARTFGSCAVYRWYPGEGDKASSEGRLEIRITASHLSDAAEKLRQAGDAIIGSGSNGIDDGHGGRLEVRRSKEGSASGYIRGSGLYFIKEGFDIRGRGDVNG